MRIARRSKFGIAGGIAALGVATALAPTASADPAGPTIGPEPVSVYQIPAVGLAVSGLVVPGPYSASVQAETAAVPGETTFSVPFSPELCATSAGGVVIHVNYLNVTSGDRGTAVVKPCPDFLEPAPTHVTVRTGSGPVAFAVAVKGTHYRPDAGQPSTLGVGGFVAP
ncbi:hypothetical protein [Rhodococcus sp. NPDC058521]|uniref:hypothetical protein n=1 Tax=Rhodococcus sp. NPDC058521 TaxID=3346536 RepID=UPI003665A6AE